MWATRPRDAIAHRAVGEEPPPGVAGVVVDHRVTKGAVMVSENDPTTPQPADLPTLPVETAAPAADAPAEASAPAADTPKEG